MPCFNEFGPLGIPRLEWHLLIGMALTVKPGELVLKLLTIFRQPTGCWMLEFMVQCATAQFGASENH